MVAAEKKGNWATFSTLSTIPQKDKPIERMTQRDLAAGVQREYLSKLECPDREGARAWAESQDWEASATGPWETESHRYWVRSAPKPLTSKEAGW